MIDRDHDLPLTRQAALVGLSRASLYYTARECAAAVLRVMHRLDALHLELPFAGSRMLRDLLRGEGISIGRDHVRTLMRRMGISAIYRRPRTSQRHAYTQEDKHEFDPFTKIVCGAQRTADLAARQQRGGLGAERSEHGQRESAQARHLAGRAAADV